MKYAAADTAPGRHLHWPFEQGEIGPDLFHAAMTPGSPLVRFRQKGYPTPVTSENES
jgi:hypothetical protein